MLRSVNINSALERHNLSRNKTQATAKIKKKERDESDLNHHRADREQKNNPTTVGNEDN